MKLSRGEALLIASHNQGKVREIADLLSPYGVNVRGAAELNLAEPEETGATFVDNALLKARAAAEASGMKALADDSGLCVNALDGAPGIMSARWAGPKRSFALAMARVERELKVKGAKDLSAKFVCVLALATSTGEAETFEGEVLGRLIFPPRGRHGFGYDPIFVAEGMSKTFGEIDPAEKRAISHRAIAFEKFASTVLMP